MGKYSLSVVIPCYDEKNNIPLLLEKFDDVLKDYPKIEVVLVDNGSTDGSAQVLKELLPKYGFVRTVKVEVNQGYGYGILQGLKICDSDFLGWTHADMQTDPKDIVRAYELLSDTDLFLKGRRKGRPFFDVIFTVGMSVYETLSLKVPLYDINAQPNIFPKSFYDSWENPPYDFALDLYALYLAKKRKLLIRRFDVNFPPRQHGESKWNHGFKSKLKFIQRTVSFTKQMKIRGLT